MDVSTSCAKDSSTSAHTKDLGSESDRAYTAERLEPGHLQHAEIVACLLFLFIKAAQT